MLLRRRPDKGLLGGLMEFPSTDWRETPWGIGAALMQAPMDAVWLEAGEVRHTFTHFHLRLAVLRGRRMGGEGTWVHPRDFHAQALPTLMKKVAKLVLG